MKKICIMAILLGCGAVLFAQQTPDKPASSQQASPEITALQLAASLAKYGYSTYSASALIEAAEILASVPTQALGASGTSDSTAKTGTKSGAKPEFTPANLLADAKKYAAGDAGMIAWADKVQRSLGAKTRGAAGGPRYQIDAVSAKSSRSYQLNFTAGKLAEVAVSGDGDTDIDLYVYDQSGNLIGISEDYSDDCYVSWVPKWTGAYTIKVVNRGGVYNRFEIATN
jgi:hypothetical protein